MRSTGHTLLAHASSSHVVSCKTRIISLISALIFSKVNLLFLSASSTPAPRLVLVATKIFIAGDRNMKGTDPKRKTKNYHQNNVKLLMSCHVLPDFFGHLMAADASFNFDWANLLAHSCLLMYPADTQQH